MKALLVTALPCDEVRKLKPESHLGFRTLGCDEIEHLIVSGGRALRTRRKCDECLLGVLIRSSYVLSGPVITPEGLVRMAAIDKPSVRRALRIHRRQLVSLEEVDVRNLVLTPRQRVAFSLLASDAGNIAGVARALGISKVAAWKLVRKSLRKIARLHS
ncbi:MAG: hypothetical protein LRS49_00165 [Desulfurococcales archaeon]|nr:hypothetical protein [Desulfurococcales archaeon]